MPLDLMLVDSGKVTDFLADLSALTQKYGIRIEGCGCCDSPYLRSIFGPPRTRGFADDGIDEEWKYGTKDFGNLTYDVQTGRYSVNGGWI